MILLRVVVGWAVVTLSILGFHWLGRGLCRYVSGPDYDSSHRNDPLAPSYVALGVLTSLGIFLAAVVSYYVGASILTLIGLK